MSIEFLANISGVEHQSQKMSLCSAKEVTKLEQHIKELEALVRIGISQSLLQKEKIKELEARLEKYNELIMEVACKFPNETRHQTAKRYIHERENREIAGPSQVAALGEKE